MDRQKNITTTGAKYSLGTSRKLDGRISISAYFCGAATLVPK
jgi:hypothetical protein